MIDAASHLHLWEDCFLCITPSFRSGLTQRSSVTLLASATGRPFTLAAHDGAVARCTAALVAPHAPRRLDADGCGLLSLNIDAASPLFGRLMRFMAGAPIVPLDTRRFGALRGPLEGALHHALDDAALRALSTGMVQALCGTAAGAEAPRDARVVHVLRTLQGAAGREPVPLHALAAQVHLSPSRLTHLFHEQTGQSIRRYLLWTKIRRAAPLLLAGVPLTECALESGFTDAAHMSRTCQRYFGRPPSVLAAGHFTVHADPARLARAA